MQIIDSGQRCTPHVFANKSRDDEAYPAPSASDRAVDEHIKHRPPASTTLCMASALLFNYVYSFVLIFIAAWCIIVVFDVEEGFIWSIKPTTHAATALCGVARLS